MILRAASLICTIVGSAAVADDWTEAELTEMATDAGLDPQALLIAGDAEYGAYLGSECTTCHRADGTDAGIPAIDTLDALSFKLAMHAYKTGDREHPVMQMIAGRLGDEEIASLAEYFTTKESQ